MTKITATGTSVRHYAAERATVSIGIAVTHESRNEAIGAAATLHNEALRLGRLLEDDRRATFVKGLPPQTYASTRDDGHERTPVFVSRSTVLVKLSDLSYVSEFVNDLQTKGYTANVSWSLTKRSTEEHTSTVRRRAVEKAAAVADDYATALGTSVGKVVSISDVIVETRTFSGAVDRKAGAAPVAEVTIPEIAVSASVVGVYKTAKTSGLDY